MNLPELQKEIRNLFAANDASVAAYLSCAKEMDEMKEEFPSYMRSLRVAFLGSFTIQGLAEIMRAKGIFYNLSLQCYTAPYNQFSQQVLAKESDLYAFNPQLAYLLIDTPDVLDDAHIHDVVDSLLNRTNAKIVLFNFVAGPHADEEKAQALNQKLKELYANNSRIIFFDFNSFLDRAGREQTWYTKYVDLGDMRIAPWVFPILTESLMAYAVATAGNTKKCIVLDLDNTLWRGIVGEDGADGVEPDREFQKNLFALFEKGIILAINSKNNLEDAMQVIDSHPHMVLRRNNFAAWRINWETKEKNIAELAEELNLGIDSFVFVDDDRATQSRVAH